MEEREPRFQIDDISAERRNRHPAIDIRPDYEGRPANRRVSEKGSAPTFWGKFKREWRYNASLRRDLLITGVVVAAIAKACSSLSPLPPST